MENKQGLISIGKLSKLTGVHIQSLRYYEELGILKPAYTAKSSGYRYYAFGQMRIVEAIQYCAAIGIPLRDFCRFAEKKNGEIDYGQLIQYGKEVIGRKMRKIRQHMQFLEDLQRELDHSSKYGLQKNLLWHQDEIKCYCTPYQGNQRGKDFSKAVFNMVQEMESKGLRAGYIIGMLMETREGRSETFLFVNICERGRALADIPQIRTIPAGEYFCVLEKESDIQKAAEVFPQYFGKGRCSIVLEMELLTEPYHYMEPAFELRCLPL